MKNIVPDKKGVISICFENKSYLRMIQLMICNKYTFKYICNHDFHRNNEKKKRNKGLELSDRIYYNSSTAMPP